MKVVSLICTFHEERGRISVPELHTILECIRPEVIFLEAPSDLLRDQFDVGRLGNLESRAVLRYLESHPAHLIPVDLPTPKASFFRKAEQLFSHIERASYEYGRLIDQNKEKMLYEGFSYLNSESNDKYHSELHEEILRVVERQNSKWMADAYREWLQMMELRDIEMLRNIEKHSRENQFGRATFLVGAAHRASIMSKTRQREVSELTEIRWVYSEQRQI